MTRNVQYDPAIIQKLADNLYAQAASVVAIYTLACVLIGGATGFALGQGMNIGPVVGLGLAVVLGIFGYFVGESRAFALRPRAQEALCQIRIEANTRKL